MKTDIDTQIESLLKEFLNATDYVLEVADEAPLDDPDFFDRPYQEAHKDIKTLLIQSKISMLESLSKKQQTFVGYGYDDVGVDINDIDDEIKALKEEL